MKDYFIPADGQIDAVEFRKDQPLYMAAMYHDGNTDKTSLEVKEFKFVKYETPQVVGDISNLAERLIVVIDPKYPHIEIKHQSSKGYFSTINGAELSLYEGLCNLLSNAIVQMKKDKVPILEMKQIAKEEKLNICLD